MRSRAALLIMTYNKYEYAILIFCTCCEMSGRSSRKENFSCVKESNMTERKDIFVHESSYVDDGVEIGEGTKIWHFSHILTGTSIGKNCSFGQNVMAGPDVIIGDNCKIQNNVAIYKGVTLEDGVFCGPSMVFTNVTTPRSEVNRRNEYAQTLVRKGATLGANSTIVCGHELGEYCFIAAGAVVTKDVIPHAVMAGIPAKQIGWVAHSGEMLRSDMICPRTGDNYEVQNGALIRIQECSTE